MTNGIITNPSNVHAAKSSRTRAAKAHHTPANVKILSVYRTEMKQYVDSHYCKANVKMLKSIAGYLGDNCTFISQDNKAKML